MNGQVLLKKITRLESNTDKIQLRRNKRRDYDAPPEIPEVTPTSKIGNVMHYWSERHAKSTPLEFTEPPK